MKRSHLIPLGLTLALWLTGCSQPADLLPPDRLDPAAPAASSLPAVPGPDEPAPLASRPPFGLYAEAPTADTLAQLSQGTLSPDQRFRAALTQQGTWIARVDAAWLWQIQLPAPTTPATTQTPTSPPADTGQAGTTAPTATPAAPPAIASLAWTPRATLLLRDAGGTWWEANPVWATASQLPAALQGKEELQFSPDGSKVLYYTAGTAGRQLWVAAADGSGARLLGTNVVGSWSPEGEPVVEKLPPVAPPAGTPAGQATTPGTSP